MASLSTPISYHRVNRIPLDDTEIFNDLRSLMDYCDSGPKYSGQRVAVINESNNGMTKYTLNHSIPIIDMKGSEPIFKTITFDNDSTNTYGLLIYQNNGSYSWSSLNESFIINESKLCLFNQLEIFRTITNGNKIYKFYMERINRNTGEITIYKWNQNYNPYTDRSSHIFNPADTNNVTEFVCDSLFNYGCGAKTNKAGIYIMPKSDEAINVEKDIITRIYIKADLYYYAYNDITN